MCKICFVFVGILVEGDPSFRSWHNNNDFHIDAPNMKLRCHKNQSKSVARDLSSLILTVFPLISFTKQRNSAYQEMLLIKSFEPQVHFWLACYLSIKLGLANCIELILVIFDIGSEGGFPTSKDFLRLH